MSNKKHFGLLALTLASFSSMIGSGWLFGAWKAARLAGPASLLAWPIGAVAIGLLAFAYAELGARYPAIGGMARYTQLSHGSFAGFLAGWANWIAIVAVIAIEAVSSVQYLSSFSSAWFRGLYNMPAHHLTPSGLVLSAVFIVFYFLVNYWSVTLFMRSMMAITFFKIAVPLITCAALFISATMDHSFHFTQTAFMPYGFSGVLTAVSTAGVIFSFHGFQSAINLSGEAKNPKRNVPLAILFSLLGATVLYIILQYVFVGVVSSQTISQGWRNLNMSSPYVHLALSLQLNWLVLLLYLDAVVSPSGTAITYTATTSRMLYAMRGNGYMPAFLGKLHRRYRIPRGAMWVNLVVSFLFLFVFKGWSRLVAVISVSTIISYLNGPISAVALRRWKTKAKNPLKIKGLVFIAPLAFVVISLVLYWARWPLTGEVILIMLLGLPVYFYYQHKNKWLNFKENLITGSWLFLYLMVIAVISWIGSREFGGMGWLSMTDSIMLVITVALIFYYYGLRSAFRFINAKMIAEKKAARRKARQKTKSVLKQVVKKKK